jgi:CRISPR system Cascade subunit CasC
VAHAITTHRIDLDDDFYTAIDDLKQPSEDAGASFIGELAFGSGVFYLYACINRDQLEQNLSGETGLAASAIAAFTEGFATTSPSGKQNSFAAHARASYLRVEKGPQQPRSLAAAFFKPIRGEDLLTASVSQLEAFATQMNEAYGDCHHAEFLMKCLPGEPLEGSISKAIAFAAAD